MQNNAPGLWFDRSSYDSTVAENLFQDNFTVHGMQLRDVGAGDDHRQQPRSATATSGLFVYESSQVSLSHNL